MTPRIINRNLQSVKSVGEGRLSNLIKFYLYQNGFDTFFPV